MPLYPELKLLYLHIPKTGGTSIERYMVIKSLPKDVPMELRNCGNIAGPHDFHDKWWVQHMIKHSDRMLYSLEPHETFQHTLQHLTYPEVVELIGQDTLDATVDHVLVSTRNPYTRFLSDLFYVYKDALKIKHTMSLAEVRHLLDRFTMKYEARIVKEGYNAFDNHARPQWHYIRDCPPEKLRVVRTEHLASDMSTFDYADFTFQDNKNTSLYPYDALLTPKITHFVQKHYGKDFETFGYIV